MNTMRTSSSLRLRYHTKVVHYDSCSCAAIPYKILVIYRDRAETISNPVDFPEVSDVTSHVKEVQEPVVKASIIVPQGLILTCVKSLHS